MLRLIPLGGLGEIGMNCLAVEHDGDVLVIDCGVLFDSRNLGVDLIHADFTYLLDRASRVRALIVTHGHEDHIGAVTWLLRDLQVPVYGPRYALALIRQRLAEQRFFDPARVDFRPFQAGDRFTLGQFDIEPWQVTHSMPDCTGLVIRTPDGILLHTGDFKIDPDPPAGDRIDLDRVHAIAREGVRILLSDSTNAMTAGHSGSERDVVPALDEIIGSAPGRVVIGLFASNVQRLRAVIDLARQHGRRVVALGRSVESHLRIAGELGIIRNPDDVLVPRERARTVPRELLLGVATGSQGEAPAALPRLAAGTHPDLDLEAGDRVVLSSRIIPGNERPVIDLINALERRGIPVIHRATDPRIHVSGHAHRDEQRQLLELVRPRAFLPVHGTYVHLVAHAQMAREAGVPEVAMIENGGILEIDDHGIRVADDRVPVGRVHIDHGEPLAERVIQDRQLLAQLGVVFVSLMVDRYGRLLSEPAVISRGVVDEEEERDFIYDLKGEIRESILAIRTPEEIVTDDLLRDAARRAVRRFFLRELNRKPLCYVNAMRATATRSQV